MSTPEHLAVITGGAGDIGLATAFRLGQEGYQLLVVDVNQDRTDAAVDQLVAAGITAQGVSADVTDPEQVEKYFEVARSLGPVRAVFNNAGIDGPQALIEDYTVEAFDLVMRVNVRGVFLGLKYGLPAVESGGAIVNTASGAAFAASAANSAYAASKHAVLGLTRSAAVGAASRGVRVNAVCPGAVDGRMMESIDRQRLSPGSPAAANPMGRRAIPGEIADAVAFLLSDRASFINGEALVVDGGMRARL